MTTPNAPDEQELEALKEYAETDAQRRALEVAIEHGSGRAAARALGVNPNTINEPILRVRKRAARMGYAPGHFEQGVAPGFVMGKVTVHRNKFGEVKQTWERQSPDAQAQLEAVLAAISDAARSLPRLPPIAAPSFTLQRLLNLYIFTDYHLGMRAWAEEGGADWDLQIAEDLIVQCFEHMIASAPAARVGLIGQLGDFLHFDSLLPVTPTSKHVLDASAHYKAIVDAAIRIMRRMIDFALHRHDEVVVLAAEGNHDMIGGGVWLPALLAVLYENEPRVTVIRSATPYYAYEFGKTMLAFHHGHMKKKESLPELFADTFDEMWGRTKKRYAHTGHFHHEVIVTEKSGMRVIQHPTLAPNDSHSARGGYSPHGRQTSVITYHERFGKASEQTVTPEMLAA